MEVLILVQCLSFSKYFNFYIIFQVLFIYLFNVFAELDCNMIAMLKRIKHDLWKSPR